MKFEQFCNRGIIQEYIELAKERRRYDLGIQQYLYRIFRFFKWMARNKIRPKNLTEEDIAKYLNTLSSENEKRLSAFAIKDFLEFIYYKYKYDNIKEILESAKTSKFSPLRFSVTIERKKPKYGLTVEEMRKIIEITEEEPSFQSALTCSFYFGWRPIEATVKLKESLKKGLVNYDERRLVIETAKRKDRDRDRVIPYPEVLDDYFKYWCKFVSHLNNKTMHMYIRTRCYRWQNIFMKKIGKAVTPVVIRRSVETWLQIRNVQQAIIDYFLGHKLRTEVLENMIERRPMAEVYAVKEEICEKLVRPELEKKHFIFEVIS